jgi:glycerophosphoryl diester phosphodiesterase
VPATTGASPCRRSTRCSTSWPESSRRGQVVGVYPETKHPSYFSSVGLPLEEPLVRALRGHGLDRPNAQVYVQSFEVANLRRLDTMLRVPLVQVIARTGTPYDLRAVGDPRTYADLLTPVGLREVSTYADVIGVDKQLVVPRDSHGSLAGPTSLVEEAHRAGLQVHAFTFRDENRFLPTDLRGRGAGPTGDAAAEYVAHYDAGVDAVFSDHADTALRARARWLQVRAHSSSGMSTQPMT